LAIVAAYSCVCVLALQQMYTWAGMMSVTCLASTVRAVRPCMIAHVLCLGCLIRLDVDCFNI